MQHNILNLWEYAQNNCPQLKGSKFIDLVREVIRTNHFSNITEKTYIGWIVPPQSPEILKQTILTIRDNYIEISEKSRKARQVCCEYYSKDIITTEFNRIISFHSTL